MLIVLIVLSSVADPNPDPSDPYVFGPPGSGSINQRHGSGFGSFYHQTKIVRKSLIPTVLLLLFNFLSLKNYVYVPLKSNKQKNFNKYFFFICLLKVNDENWRIRIRIQIHYSDACISGFDPDPHQNFMDPQHWS
jgi:hypothetical protein